MTVSNISELQLRLGKIETIYNHFDEVQTCLECLDELDLQLQERMSFESQYFDCVVMAQQIIERFQRDNNRSKLNETVSHINNHKLVKLPTIQLPKFSGSYNIMLYAAFESRRVVILFSILINYNCSKIDHSVT